MIFLKKIYLYKMKIKSPSKKMIKKSPTKKNTKKPPSKRTIPKKSLTTSQNKISGYKFHKKMGVYDFYAPSKTSGKKYDAYKNGKKLASFGAIGYSQYKDRIGYYKSKDHNDPSRRKRYQVRHQKDKLTAKYKQKESPGYFSMVYLW
jgi:hypothetical protein